MALKYSYVYSDYSPTPPQPSSRSINYPSHWKSFPQIHVLLFCALLDQSHLWIQRFRAFYWTLVVSPVAMQVKAIIPALPLSIAKNSGMRGRVALVPYTPMPDWWHTHSWAEPVHATAATANSWLRWVCHVQKMAFSSLSISVCSGSYILPIPSPWLLPGLEAGWYNCLV